MKYTKAQLPEFKNPADQINWFMCPYVNGTNFRLLNKRVNTINMIMLWEIMDLQLELIKYPQQN